MTNTNHTAAANAARDKALLTVLRDADIENEDGEAIRDFTNRNRDSQDFGTVSRQQIQQMLFAAYYAGRNSK